PCARSLPEAPRQQRSRLRLKGMRSRPWGDRRSPRVDEGELDDTTRACPHDRAVRPGRERLRANSAPCLCRRPQRSSVPSMSSCPVSCDHTDSEDDEAVNIKTFGPVDERSLQQLERCMTAGEAEFGVLCADHHPGYSQPIGGGIAYEGYVSPSGVGYDIGCGNKAARTALTRADLEALGGIEKIMREITRRISFGMGVPAAERVDHPVLDRIRNADFAP